MDWKKMTWPTQVSAGVMLFAGTLILVWSVPGIFRIGAPAALAAPPQEAAAPSTPSAAPNTAPAMEALQKLAADVNVKYADLKAQVDYNAKSAENMGKLLAFLTFATSLFVILLGANSYFGFREILKSADADLARAHARVESLPKDIEDMKAEIYAAYPMLQNVDRSLKELVATLHDVLPGDVNWREDLKLTEASRQRALNAELTVAALEVFQLGSLERYSRRVSEIYRGLAQFYANQAVQVASPAPVGRHAPKIQRALLYIAKACRMDGTNAAASRDFGAFHAVRGDFAGAKEKYQESLDIDREEPGALFGLAYIEAVSTPPELADAIARMTVLIQKSKWEPGQKKKYLAEAYTNRACYQARLAPALAAADQDASYAAAIRDLEEGYPVAKEHDILPFWQRGVEREKSKGDLVELNRRFGTRIDVLLQ